MSIKSIVNDTLNSLQNLHREGNVITTSQDIGLAREKLLAEEIAQQRAQKNEQIRNQLRPNKEDVLPLKAVLDVSQIKNLPTLSKRLVPSISVTTRVYDKQEVYTDTDLACSFLLGALIGAFFGFFLASRKK